ncbi:GNAT family N-acetyltransferase [Pseudemcibacter aquimaris]|uniref:GNAT family N-acetyltransferase n=1 Tax=Pseudemcibacter aquimaris TaxID=2857064 RepID=UPI0020137FAE|nr:GNAT family N-acetyltransferase [Pseudemcibacter aquimaris]MCC3860940.1 GNAT family N-acetyltransferase [Pseudemcibacter aquimaris]WDU59759.1 GNAT family N-acetyltransferase [Pseudemcibacter aquimaris]
MYSIETERLLMRPFEMDDVDFLDYLHSDMDVVRYTSGYTRSHEENIGFLKMMHEFYERDLGHLLVIQKSDLTPVGRAGLYPFYGVIEDDMEWLYTFGRDSVKKQGDVMEVIDLGYTIDKAAWGKGFATEAASGVRDYSFENLGYDKLASMMIKENTASVRVAEKMGAGNPTEIMVNEKPALKLTQYR